MRRAGTTPPLVRFVPVRLVLRAIVPTLLAAQHAAAQSPPPKAPVTLPAPAAQNPSPMVENTRAHERLVERKPEGVTRTFVGPAGKPVELFVPERSRTSDRLDLVIHFHGAAWVAEQGVAPLAAPTAVAAVNVGSGSGAYDRAFTDPAVYDTLLATITRELSAATARPTRIGRVTLIGFSAGHGAVRAILRDAAHFAQVDAVLLIDGMHTSYIPDGTALSNGGTIDTTNLVAFAQFARAAMRGEKRFLVTHSEIFPGTFASTTETADWLLGSLALRRTPTLAWGARGMQQLSQVRAGNFELLGYAGNSAPDHIDQLHALPELLARLLALRSGGAERPALRTDEPLTPQP
jgi:hypothetical protein